MSDLLEAIDLTNDLLGHLRLLNMAARGIYDQDDKDGMWAGTTLALAKLQAIKSTLIHAGAPRRDTNQDPADQ